MVVEGRNAILAAMTAKCSNRMWHCARNEEAAVVAMEAAVDMGAVAGMRRAGVNFFTFFRLSLFARPDVFLCQLANLSNL